jgi:hypothetical protein
MRSECGWFGSEKGKAGKATDLDDSEACRDKGNEADREAYGAERLPEKIQTGWPVALAEYSMPASGRPGNNSIKMLDRKVFDWLPAGQTHQTDKKAYSPQHAPCQKK